MQRTLKPRNSHGHSILMSKRSERHEDTAGRRAKRARLKEQYDSELDSELEDYFAGEDEYDE